MKKISRAQIKALNQLRDHMWNCSKESGFKDKKVPVGDMCSNLHGEVSELWEAYRKRSLMKPCDKAEEMESNGLPGLTCAEEELADILIRVLDTSYDLGINIGEAVMVKNAYNQTRPRKHGGKIA